MNSVVALLITQACFTAGDLWARSVLAHQPFQWTTFLQPWFIGYLLLRTVATAGQLFVLSNMPAGKTMAFFGVTSILLVNIASWFFLREILQIREYVAIAVAALAFVLLAWK